MILILPNGKVMVFNIAALAVTYQQAYGGTLIEKQLTEFTIVA